MASILPAKIKPKTFAGIKKKKNREIKLRWFQTKICCRILVTNSILKDTGVVKNNVCTFCLTEKDTILHFMCQCEHTQSYWVRSEMCWGGDVGQLVKASDHQAADAGLISPCGKGFFSQSQFSV